MGKRVLLVGYEDQDNLGIRYLSSRLLQEGHDTRIVAFGSDPGPLLQVIESERPDVVGFSLIFQYMVPAFGAVIRALRAAGVGAHFTVGGHYGATNSVICRPRAKVVIVILPDTLSPRLDGLPLFQLSVEKGRQHITHHIT